VFSNNWISFHENGDAALYPMFAANRRSERREEILDMLEEKGFKTENIVLYLCRRRWFSWKERELTR
jgi:hypothetical protein